ncbi:rab11 family-interacting protein 3 isoform X1 [Gopherus evgoodei]|uniref:rab11 family-interacting protein 3 isoform X1 n=1 Tax=Gopherus evgoodei TaxID=1825980 RepID=UPI0011CEEB7A|nr:rab11 family-interacting protein 3 isoform X1 [Gopherus evgoodei]
MKMEPDLLMTLSDPGSKSERASLLTLFAEQNGRYLIMEQRGQLPSPDLVLVPRESLPDAPLFLGPSLQERESGSVVLEQVLGEMKLSGPDPMLFSDRPIEYLYRMEKQENGLLDQDTTDPISDLEQESGAGDNHHGCPHSDFDLNLSLGQGALASAQTIDLEEQFFSLVLDQAVSSPLPDLPLKSAGLSPEDSNKGESFPESIEILQAEGEFYLGMETSQEENSSEGLTPTSPWTKETEDYISQSCQETLSLSTQDFSQIDKEMDLFPTFHSSSNLSQALDFAQPDSITNDSLGCQEEENRLQAVFDALDGDGDGFVRIEEFVQFATVYGAEQVKDLTKYLDPSGLGVISFEDFYRGIGAIRNGDSDIQLYEMGYTREEEPSVCPDEFYGFVMFEANEVTDSAYMGSESTYSECETFTDEDTGTLVHPEMHEEVETDSAIDSTVHSEFTDPIEDPENGSHPHDLPLSSDLNNHSIVTVISGEEHFEDYGEGNEADLFSDSLCNGETSFSSSSFLSPSVNPLIAKLHSIITDEAFEFYCSQCHKQINRLEDLSARLNDLEMNSPNKRLSSKKVARHLHQTGTLTADAMEEPFCDHTECADEDITDKVVFLEKRVTELEKDTAANGEQHSRLKQENLQLVHRANALEEQLKEQELKADEMLLEEIRKQREFLTRMEREKSIEIENLQARLQQLEDENSELRSCVPCLKASIERLEEEKQKLLDEIEDLTAQLNEEQESKRKMGDKLAQERHQFQKEKESTQELIEDLRKQLEHLQLFKLEAEQRRGRSSSVGLQEYNSRTRETELEQEIRRLKQDNRNLKEQNDELNGQIINLSIQGAKNLFSASFSESLAAEISSVSRDELMEAIQKQEEINFRLQDYIDRIIVAIMETNPSILEVK